MSGLDDIRERMAEQADYLVKQRKENPRPESTMRLLCEREAEHIAEDIRGDHPTVDVSFEVYVYDGDKNGPVGFIYMGECGSWAFTFGDDESKIEQRDDLHDWAKSLSPYRSW